MMRNYGAEMTVLNKGHFARLGVGRVPKCPTSLGRRRVPKYPNRTVRHEANGLSPRYRLTRHFLYHSDKLSRLALPSD
jgi:hypothetical protein